MSDLLGKNSVEEVSKQEERINGEVDCEEDDAVNTENEEERDDYVSAEEDDNDIPKLPKRSA